MSRDLSTLTNIKPYTVGNALTTSIVDQLAAPTTGHVYKIESIIVSNIDGTNDADVDVIVYMDGAQYYIAKTVTVPADSTLIVTTSDTPIYLEATYYKLQAKASAAGDLQILISYQDITTSA